ncbi:Ig-like domain-containing protein, partial [Rhodonellum ikkaensis]
MKMIGINFSRYFVAFFWFSFCLILSFHSNASSNSKSVKEGVSITETIPKNTSLLNNWNSIGGKAKLSLNSVGNNVELKATNVYEINANNFVQLVAEPQTGYLFSYWSLDGQKVSENSVYEFLMLEKDILVSAHFIQITLPTVQITSPIEKSVYGGLDIIEVNIEATSGLGEIEKVQLFLNENLISTFYEFPYKYNLKEYSEGEYAIKAIATDNTGQFSISEVIKFSIEKANVAPTVSISSPAQNASFFIGDNISITANAADADGTIAKVEFYYGNTLLGTDTTS